MRVPRMTTRRWMLAVAVFAILLAAGNAFVMWLGPRDGGYHGSYRYLGSDWKWHEIRGTVIFVEDGFIFVD
jgi:hypothetical protein